MSRSTISHVTPVFGVFVAFFVSIALLFASADSANAAASPVGLGAANSFAVLGYSTVTNTGPSTISGDIGLHSGSSVTGFPPGVQTSGAMYVSDALSLQARTDANNAFTSASGQTPVTSLGAVELGGLTLPPDIYETDGVLQASGVLTLDGGGDSSAVFIFRSTSTLITGSASQVALTGSANPCNVFWIVPSSATFGTGSSFVGTVIASDSIIDNGASSVIGRLLALNGAVTLNNTTVSSTGCAAVASAAGSTLPRTGVTAWPLVVAGGVTLASGALLLFLRRRTTRSE